jgi:hypothetical protein
MDHRAANVIKVTKPVPSELAQFMQYVWYYGIEGHEEWAESVSDDLIQAPNVAPVIGGLCDKKAKRFFFTYRPKDTPGTNWRIYLFENEIEDIAKGNVRDLVLWKCCHDGCHDLYSYSTSVRCSNACSTS